jgi:D-alanyl-D-alanine carboxypeptidase/D-alanyl-D-alanine-endopeptidase (penicillin-binding protein 4)
MRLATRLNATLVGTNGCLVVSDSSTGSAPIYIHQPSVPFAPASTQKLLVAATALSVLGPDFRFVTKVVAPAAPASGRVDSLWLVGSGDALLASPEFVAYTARMVRVAGYPWTPLATLADSLVAAGIHSIPGGIRGDDSHFDQLRWLPAWPASYRNDQQIGFLSALTLNEGVQTWTPKTTLATDPPALASSELARLASARGAAVGPTGPDQAAPANGVVVAQVESAPLGQVIEAMLRASDNLIAELLVREIDRHVGPVGGGTGNGTTAGGLAVVAQRAASFGVPMAGGVMLDGSGLAPGDRATCNELLAALQLGARPGLSPLVDGLAVAARSGTLATRFIGTPVAGKLWAKTGSIDNAGGMVGVLRVTRPIEFALLINQPMSYPQLTAKEDQVVAGLATFPEG